MSRALQKAVEPETSFNLGTSLASTLGLGSDHRSFRGTSPKSTTVSPERERGQFQRAERSAQFVSAVGEPRYT